MKRPIRFAGMSAIWQVILALVFGIFGAWYLISSAVGSSAPNYLLVIIAIILIALGFFGVMFYNGFYIIGKRFEKKLLSITSSIFMIWTVIMVVAGIIGLIVVQPIIKNKVSEFQELAKLQENAINLNNLETQNNDNQNQSINIQSGNSLPTNITSELSNPSTLSAIKDLIPQKTLGYLTWFFVIGLAIQIIALLFTIGILKLGDKIPYAKTTGILGIITNGGNFLGVLLYLLMFLALASPVALIGLYMVSSLLGLVVGIVGIIFFIFEIILLFKASAELEKSN